MIVLFYIAEFCHDTSLLATLNENYIAWSRWGANEPWSNNWSDPRILSLVRDTAEQEERSFIEPGSGVHPEIF